MDDNLPVYIISSAAELLGIHPRTLHLYEEKGLLVSVRKGNRRFYSASDLQWIQAIRYLVHEQGLNLEGLRRLLALRAELAYQHASPEPGERARLAECQGFIGRTAPCWERRASANAFTWQGTEQKETAPGDGGGERREGERVRDKPVFLECHDCPVYLAARAGLQKDEGAPRLAL